MNKLREKFPDISIVCTTATATPRTLSDIRKTLNIPHAFVMKGVLTRKNLHYHIVPKSHDYLKDIIDYISKRIGDTGIIYCLTKEEAETMNQNLNVCIF